MNRSEQLKDWDECGAGRGMRGEEEQPKVSGTPLGK